MRKALQYIANIRIRLNGYSVVTVEEAMRACEMASEAEKEASVKAFCKVVCSDGCRERNCEKYQAFIGRIGYKISIETLSDIEEQTLF